MGKTNELIQRFFGEPARNLMHAMYDDYVEANVKFRSRSGVKTFIIRRQLSKCCDWCADLAGIYEAAEAPEDIYRRHDNCKCMVTFRNEKGKYVDAWSKKEFDTQKEARINRIKEIENASNTRINMLHLKTLTQETLASNQNNGIIKSFNKVDFYAGPNRKVMEAKYRAWIGKSKRDAYLAVGKDSAFLNVINMLYRPGSFIGDGGTSDVLRFEKKTGLNLGKTGSHLQKSEEIVRYIKKKVLPRNLSSDERKIITDVLDDLEKAIKEYKS